jgi:hypothetical protein
MVTTPCRSHLFKPDTGRTRTRENSDEITACANGEKLLLWVETTGPKVVFEAGVRQASRLQESRRSGSRQVLIEILEYLDKVGK